MTDNEKFMRRALELAKLAASRDEVPVGAVIVKNGEIIAEGYNRKEELGCAVHHAEIVAIQSACAAERNWWLEDCDLFVTLEPCVMCCGAIVNSRMRKVYFGASDQKAGGCGSVTDVFALPLNHRVECEGGLLDSECAKVLSDYFRTKRARK